MYTQIFINYVAKLYVNLFPDYPRNLVSLSNQVAYCTCTEWASEVQVDGFC